MPERNSASDAPPAAGEVDEAPISIVIAWVNDIELLRPCLDALRGQRAAQPHEVVVATRRSAAQRACLLREYPEVRVLTGAPDATIPALRAQAIRAARGTVIAVTEDHCVPDPGWLATIAGRMRNGCAVVGGPVENAWTARLRDWAAFLTEYAALIEPLPDGPAVGLPGNNVAYRRELALELCDVLERGLWESFYHDQLRRRGTTLISDPRMRVRHRRPFGFRYFVGQRFHFCRAFAAMRNTGLSGPRRAAYALATVLLPVLLWLRGLRALLRKRRFVGRYLLCTPLIALYLTAGALGEATGYVLGGGRSLERVE